MKVREITVAVGRTVNLGNYESARVDVSVTVEVPPGEDADLVFTEAYKWVDAKLEKRIGGLV